MRDLHVGLLVIGWSNARVSAALHNLSFPRLRSDSEARVISPYPSSACRASVSIYFALNAQISSSQAIVMRRWDFQFAESF